MNLLLALLIVCSNIYMTAIFVQGQTLLKRGHQRFSSLRTEEIERKLERRLQNINNEWLLKFQEIQRQNESSSRKIQELERRLEGISGIWSQKFQEFERQNAGRGNISDVGFLAYSSNNFLTNKDTTLVFGSVIRNAGGGYNKRTGVFTAPVGGLYQLFFSILSENGTTSSIEIHVNGNTIVRSWIAASQQYHTPSASAYVRLNKADQAYFMAASKGANLDGYRYSTIGGELIRY